MLGVTSRIPAFLRDRMRRLAWFSRAPIRSRLPTLTAREAYDLWSETYGVKPNLFQQIEQKALLEVLPALRGRTVLDLGCGRGRVARLALRDGAVRVIAVDRSAAMIRAGASSGAAPSGWARADAACLPFRAEAFDTVVCALMMGHIENPGAVLEEIARVSCSGGDAVITDFHPSATRRGWQRSFQNPRDGREYAVEQHEHPLRFYFSHLERLGFELEELREPLYQGFPVAFALRARKC